MITTPGSDSQEVGPLADRMPRKRSTRFVARRRAEIPTTSMEPMVTEGLALYSDSSKHPTLYDTSNLITGKCRNPVVIRTEDLDDETPALIVNAEAPAKAKSLDYLMDETETNQN
jgi:BRCT domain type II-containing protein